MNLLIAEDDPIIRMLDSAFMREWGFSFDFATNGVEAVERVRQNSGKYDLCLMDIDMPRMNGIEAARRIRECCPYVPIVALTAEPGHRNACLDVGMDAFLVKPYHSEQLHSTIDELTTKPITIEVGGDSVSIAWSMPMNAEELHELRELKKRGLTKLKIVGLGQAFVVHRNIQFKISHDLIGENKELSEFIDRSPSEPGRCHLYKANLHVTKDLFLPEELEVAMREEDEIAVRFSKATEGRDPN